MKMRTIRVIILIACFHGLGQYKSSHAQSADSLSQTVNKKRLKGLAIAGAAGYSTLLIGLNQVWYKDFERQSFHFFNDNAQWKQVDKVGHFYSTFHLSYASSRSLQWAGMKPEKADLWGSAIGVLVMMPIEIMDGLSSGYGASTGDIIANLAGSGFFLGQQLLWKEVRIQPKFSFSRSQYAPLRPGTLGSTFTEEVIKDYNGQTYWLSFDLHAFLPEGNKFPGWLNVAAGYGAEGMIYADDASNENEGFEPFRQYYFALDLDLNHFKGKSRLVNSLLFLANMIKIPAPTMEYSRGSWKFHFFYF